MPQIHIALPSNLTKQHLNILLKYFEDRDQLSSDDWKVALASFRRLGKGIISIGKKRINFKQFYDYFVDHKYANDFISHLMELQDLQKESEMFLQNIAFEILERLKQEGIYQKEIANSEYLAAYCVYWWTSFARGYRFELMIFRDLQASGITFISHNLRKRKERLSPYDLVVLNQLGDVKSTTYFLHTTQTLALNCDFYITRLYDIQNRCYLVVVLMTEKA